MDAEFDLDTESMSDNEAADPLIPIWLRQQYTEVDPDLVMTYSSVSTYEKKAAPEQAPEPAPESAPFVMLPDKKDWYILIDSIDGTRIDYNRKEIKTRLRENILAGMHDKNSSAMVFKKKKPYFLPQKDHWNLECNWNKRTTTLTKFAKKHFALGVLYQPIWSYAKAGLKWGGAIGFILLGIYSFFDLYQTDPLIASQYADSAFLLPIILVNVMIGAIFGCPPGMTVGGIIGWFRRQYLPRAFDAEAESSLVIIKVILLPILAGGGAIIACFVIMLLLFFFLLSLFLL